MHIMKKKSISEVQIVCNYLLSKSNLSWLYIFFKFAYKMQKVKSLYITFHLSICAIK